MNDVKVVRVVTRFNQYINIRHGLARVHVFPLRSNLVGSSLTSSPLFET